MDIFDILEIVIVVICAVTYGVMIFYRTRGNVIAAVSEFVALAETTGLPGSEKMNRVVEALSLKVPAPLRKILTKERLKKIAQTIFDWMRKYADEYNAKTEAGETQTSEEAKEDALTAAADLISQLLLLSIPELKERATEYGVELDGLESKEDILQAIIHAALKKA